MEDDPTQQTTENWVAGKTKKGHSIRIKPNNMGHFYIIIDKTKRLPGKLEGLYTSIVSAQQSVNAYLIEEDYVYKTEAIDRALEESNGKRASRTSKR